MVGERVETTKHVAVARNEAAAARLKVAEAAKTIIFELKEPFGVVERLLSPRRDDRLYAGKCHPADMARPTDFVQCASSAAELPDAPVTGIIQTEIPMVDEIGNPEARRSSKGVHGCAVCRASALFGFANDPRVRY